MRFCAIRQCDAGIEQLAKLTERSEQSLHRMLSPKGNPSMDNLAAIFGAVNSKIFSQHTQYEAEEGGINTRDETRRRRPRRTLDGVVDSTGKVSAADGAA